VTGALLTWMVLYVSFLAIAGFCLFVLRSFMQRGWSNRVILRASSIFAFLASSAIWLLTIIGDWPG
jgi:hypothetical protein